MYMVKIWGGSPSTEPLSFGVESSVPHDHEKELGEENASNTSSDLSFQADQPPQGGENLFRPVEKSETAKVLKSRG